MDLPDSLRFDPVPVRGRRDGWTPDVQRRFILLLAGGAPAREAARRVGRSRSTAYALRERPGAEGFAAAWDAALDLATQRRNLPRAGTPSPIGPGIGGLEMMLVPRYYRGRLVGFVQREDRRAALRVLRQIDRAVDRMDAKHAGRVRTAPSYEEAIELLARSFGAEADKADRLRP